MAEKRITNDAGGLALAAVELMKVIAASEKEVVWERQHWFRLYRQCLKAVQGQPPEQILQDD